MNSATTARLYAGREAELAGLDQLARRLWLGALINSQGTLPGRLDGLAELHAALVDGQLPAAPAWPAPALATPVRRTLAELGLPAFCASKDELAEQVVASLLWHLDHIVDYRDRGNDEAAAIDRVLADFADDWRERQGLIDEMVSVFGEFDDLFKNTRWDLLRGLLRSDGWQEVVRIRRLLERLPELAKLIRQLGRARPSEHLEESYRRDLEVVEEATAPRANARVTRVPELPGETHGIHRSGRIARMLPVETMLLTHRRLRRLRLVWHARHAERALLTYDDDDRLAEIVDERQPAWRPSPRPQPERRLEMGPLLICVDTSGSMRGGAEAVAKATVLEAVRTAHAQRRPCHVFAFGGPDEIVELDIGLDIAGLERLTTFLGQSFRGGTDIGGPLERAIARLDEAGWQLADLLIASDGEFGATPAAALALDNAKRDRGLRVQGVLIGDRETIGLLELADDVFWVRDWRHYGGSNSDSPVHSKSLTANYFPGALRSPANRAATVDGEQAARAVLAAGSPAADGDRPGSDAISPENKA